MTLSALVPDSVWHAQQPLRFGPLSLSTRMTVVRLSSGYLWIHSPVTPTDDLRGALQQIGPVRAVVAPNKSHHLFFREFLNAYPDARGWVAPGLKAKRLDLADVPELGAAAPWDDELTPYFIQGLPIINETVWFHVPSRSLILTDLLFCFGKTNAVALRLVARVLGVLEELAMSRTMKLAVKDRKALAASVKPLLDLPVERIVLAHDQVITSEARTRLRRAFAWVL
jgi:hypothetical protein